MNYIKQALVHEMFNSLGTPDVRDSDIQPSDLITKSVVPSPATRRDVMTHCQECFDKVIDGNIYVNQDSVIV